MCFNARKFEHLRFGPTEQNALQYLAPDGSIIQTKESLRDLGVRINSNLSFTEQIDTAVQSGKQMAGWAFRTFRRREREVNPDWIIVASCGQQQTSHPSTKLKIFREISFLISKTSK